MDGKTASMLESALAVADFAIELRAAGRRCEMAEEARSDTMGMFFAARHDAMLKVFDGMLVEYAAARLTYAPEHPHG